jgi:hypothetical protein
MRVPIISLVLAVSVCLTGPVFAQFQQGDPGGSGLGESKVVYWRAGMTVTAVGGACRGIVGYAPIPTDWPEQQVKIVEEDVSPTARLTYRTVQGSVKQMVVKIANLAAGREAKALVKLEITRYIQLPPDETDIYVLPNVKKLSRTMRIYLSPSPYIESRHPKIRALAKEVGADKENAWEKVEAIYDWTREKVEYRNGQLKGALAALRDGTGDCEEITSLFIAGGRPGQGPLVPVPGGRRPGVRRHPRASPDPPEGRQLPPAWQPPRACPLPTRTTRRRRLGCQTAREVRPRGGGKVVVSGQWPVVSRLRLRTSWRRLQTRRLDTVPVV